MNLGAACGGVSVSLVDAVAPLPHVNAVPTAVPSTLSSEKGKLQNMCGKVKSLCKKTPTFFYICISVSFSISFSVYNLTFFNIYITLSIPLCYSMYTGKESRMTPSKLSRVKIREGRE